MQENQILIVVEGEPRGKGRPRFASRGKFTQVFTDDATKAYELKIREEVMSTLHGPEMAARLVENRKLKDEELFTLLGISPRFTGPVAIEMEIAHSIRPSWTKKKQEAARLGKIAPTIKIDFDNCAKVFCDAFNGCVWIDDTQVIEARIIKKFSDTPYVLVKVESIDVQGVNEV